MWSLSQKRALRTLCGHTEAVNAIDYDGRTVFSAAGDRTVRVWDAETGACTAVLHPHDRGIACVRFVRGLVSTTNINWGELFVVGLLRAQFPRKSIVECSHFFFRLVTGSSDQTCKLHAYPSGQLVRVFKGHTQLVRSIDVNDERFVTGSYDHQIFIHSWDESVAPVHVKYASLHPNPSGYLI